MHCFCVQIPGQPWTKLCALGSDYVMTKGATMARVVYEPPQGDIADDKVLEIVWEDLLVSDEESGSNRKLGWLFLWDVCVQKRFRLVLLNQDVSRSLGEILARCDITTMLA